MDFMSIFMTGKFKLESKLDYFKYLVIYKDVGRDVGDAGDVYLVVAEPRFGGIHWSQGWCADPWCHIFCNSYYCKDSLTWG